MKARKLMTNKEMQQFATEMLQDENFLSFVECGMELAAIRSSMGESILKNLYSQEKPSE